MLVPWNDRVRAVILRRELQTLTESVTKILAIVCQRKNEIRMLDYITYFSATKI